MSDLYIPHGNGYNASPEQLQKDHNVDNLIKAFMKDFPFELCGDVRYSHETGYGLTVHCDPDKACEECNLINVFVSGGHLQLTLVKGGKSSFEPAQGVFFCACMKPGDWEKLVQRMKKMDPMPKQVDA
jgi:hypothetical protein